ncbi:MAG TPA: riboflavin synthase [Chryseosolibacter sp.]|nr:riboflavin synthase [Chryseosolibacter sp.]
MFTGIIEAVGTVEKIRREGANTSFFIKSVISPELKVDQSVSHNGVCLTVVELADGGHWVTAIRETLQKSTLGSLALHSHVNLERCMLNNGRFDGHIVQGHADQTGIIQSIKDQRGSWLIDIEYDPTYGNITVEKGSIAVDGVSLTCFNSGENTFSVAIIPYTFEHTNFHERHPGDNVNLEFDIIGKYVRKLLTPGS